MARFVFVYNADSRLGPVALTEWVGWDGMGVGTLYSRLALPVAKYGLPSTVLQSVAFQFQVHLADTYISRIVDHKIFEGFQLPARPISRLIDVFAKVAKLEIVQGWAKK